MDTISLGNKIKNLQPPKCLKHRDEDLEFIDLNLNSAGYFKSFCKNCINEMEILQISQGQQFEFGNYQNSHEFLEKLVQQLEKQSLKQDHQQISQYFQVKKLPISESQTNDNSRDSSLVDPEDQQKLQERLKKTVKKLELQKTEFGYKMEYNKDILEKMEQQMKKMHESVVQAIDKVKDFETEGLKFINSNIQQLVNLQNVGEQQEVQGNEQQNGDQEEQTDLTLKIRNTIQNICQPTEFPYYSINFLETMQKLKNLVYLNQVPDSRQNVISDEKTVKPQKNIQNFDQLMIQFYGIDNQQQCNYKKTSEKLMKDLQQIQQQLQSQETIFSDFKIDIIKKTNQFQNYLNDQSNEHFHSDKNTETKLDNITLHYNNSNNQTNVNNNSVTNNTNTNEYGRGGYLMDGIIDLVRQNNQQQTYDADNSDDDTVCKSIILDKEDIYQSSIHVNAKGIKPKEEQKSEGSIQQQIDIYSNFYDQQKQGIQKPKVICDYVQLRKRPIIETTIQNLKLQQYSDKAEYSQSSQGDDDSLPGDATQLQHHKTPSYIDENEVKDVECKFCTFHNSRKALACEVCYEIIKK